MAMLKQLQSNPPPAQVKAVEENCVTCGGAYPYYQCLAASGNTFLEFRDNIQGYVSAAACNYNQGNPGYHPKGVANQMRPPSFAQPNVQNNQNRFGQPQGFNRSTNFNQEQPYQATAQSYQNFLLNELEKIKRMMDVSMKAMQNQIDMVKNELRNEMKTSIQTSLSSQTNEIKNMMASLPDLIPTRMTLELANRAICTPDEIARDVFVSVGKFTFPADFVVVDYESDPRVPLTLGRPFLRTARALIDVHVNLINIFNTSSEDCLEDLVSNKQSGNPTFSLHKEIASSEVTHEFHDSKGCNFLSEEFPDIDSFNDIYPHFDDNPLSGSTTYSANSLLEEFAKELALITYPPDYDDNLTCDIESDLREIEFLLYQGEDSDFKDSIDQTDLSNLDDLFVDPISEMFTNEQAPDHSFPPRFDVYPDDFLEIESDANNFDDDFFDSNGEKIKEAELLIDQLDLPCDILSEYDSVNS
nr:reverse transcriptase domain-containing protein [Tanacetum cinerariifolium]